MLHMLATVTYFSPVTNICIIRVARDHHNLAWAALTLVTAVGTARYIPNVVHLSGKDVSRCVGNAVTNPGV